MEPGVGYRKLLQFSLGGRSFSSDIQGKKIGLQSLCGNLEFAHL